jgi:ubiquitin-protein ligase
MNFNVTLCPDEGFWKGGKFAFSFTIPSDYPHTPPKVLCTTKVRRKILNKKRKQELHTTPHPMHVMSESRVLS